MHNLFEHNTDYLMSCPLVVCCCTPSSSSNSTWGANAKARGVWLARVMCLHVWFQFYSALRAQCAHYTLRRHHMEWGELSEPPRLHEDTIPRTGNRKFFWSGLRGRGGASTCEWAPLVDKLWIFWNVHWFCYSPSCPFWEQLTDMSLAWLWEWLWTKSHLDWSETH